MSAWISIDPAVVWAVHEAQLAEHGGAAGLRDGGLLESALARPENLAAYGAPDVADLAADYALWVERHHPFVDGNKRTAFVCSELFLVLNGYLLSASDTECVLTILALAAGDLSEAALADWIRTHSRPL